MPPAQEGGAYFLAKATLLLGFLGLGVPFAGRFFGAGFVGFLLGLAVFQLRVGQVLVPIHAQAMERVLLGLVGIGGVGNLESSREASHQDLVIELHVSRQAAQFLVVGHQLVEVSLEQE